ncbi:TPA: hypothetical protein ACH3X3_001877 [Trebouxia sp. C0006]
MPMLPVEVYGKAEDYSESFYLYQLEGQSAGRGYTLRIHITDCHAQGWTGSCTLQDLKGLVDDISPEDKQMLQWVVSAVRDNNFRFCSEADDPHLETEVTAGAFTIKLRSGCQQKMHWSL